MSESSITRLVTSLDQNSDGKYGHRFKSLMKFASDEQIISMYHEYRVQIPVHHRFVNLARRWSQADLNQHYDEECVDRKSLLFLDALYQYFVDLELSDLNVWKFNDRFLNTISVLIKKHFSHQLDFFFNCIPCIAPLSTLIEFINDRIEMELDKMFNFDSLDSEFIAIKKVVTVSIQTISSNLWGVKIPAGFPPFKTGRHSLRETLVSHVADVKSQIIKPGDFIVTYGYSSLLMDIISVYSSLYLTPKEEGKKKDTDGSASIPLPPKPKQLIYQHKSKINETPNAGTSPKLALLRNRAFMTSTVNSAVGTAAHEALISATPSIEADLHEIHKRHSGAEDNNNENNMSLTLLLVDSRVGGPATQMLKHLTDLGTFIQSNLHINAQGQSYTSACGRITIIYTLLSSVNYFFVRSQVEKKCILEANWFLNNGNAVLDQGAEVLAMRCEQNATPVIVLSQSYRYDKDTLTIDPTATNIVKLPRDVLLSVKDNEAANRSIKEMREMGKQKKKIVALPGPQAVSGSASAKSKDFEINEYLSAVSFQYSVLESKYITSVVVPSVDDVMMIPVCSVRRFMSAFMTNLKQQCEMCWKNGIETSRIGCSEGTTDTPIDSAYSDEEGELVHVRSSRVGRFD
ncbi:hypothetical protein PCE1_000627 [Barthelona sp. PCE]